MLKISERIVIPDHEIEWHAVRARGAGGQNVNKLATAVHLRFDILASSLPPECKRRLLALTDQRISRSGVIVIKARSHRSQEKNRREALERLAMLVGGAVHGRKKRIPTRPSRSARERRLRDKARRSQTKTLRGRVHGDRE